MDTVEPKTQRGKAVSNTHLVHRHEHGHGWGPEPTLVKQNVRLLTLDAGGRPRGHLRVIKLQPLLGQTVLSKGNVVTSCCANGRTKRSRRQARELTLKHSTATAITKRWLGPATGVGPFGRKAPTDEGRREVESGGQSLSCTHHAGTQCAARRTPGRKWGQAPQ